jgi:ABC-type transport system substrate-binding protein
MYSYWNQGDWDMYIWYWTGEPDPNYQLTTLMSDQCGELSDGCWSNPEYDDLVREQETIVDPDARQEVVHEALALSYAEVPSIALAYPNNIEAYRNDLVTGFTPVPGDNGYLIPNYNNVGVGSDHRRRGGRGVPDLPARRASRRGRGLSMVAGAR